MLALCVKSTFYTGNKFLATRQKITRTSETEIEHQTRYPAVTFTPWRLLCPSQPITSVLWRNDLIDKRNDHVRLLSLSFVVFYGVTCTLMV